MKGLLVTFAVGAGVVYLAQKGGEYLAKPGADGKPPLGATVAQYAVPIAGGLALVAVQKFIVNP